MFRPARLLQHACRVTLFTRANCSLCDDAKLVLSDVWNKRPFDYTESDVMTAGQERWRELYEFDTPVVRTASTPSTAHPADDLVIPDPRREVVRRHRTCRDDDSSAQAHASLQTGRSRAVDGRG